MHSGSLSSRMMATWGRLALAGGLLASCSEPADRREALIDLSQGFQRGLSPGRVVGQRAPGVPGTGERLEVSAAADFGRWKATIDSVRQAADREASPEAINDSGLLALLTGHLDRAVHLLEWAAELDPGGNAETDLAAAYLARAETDDRVTDLLLALEAARRAVEQHADLPEPAFNFSVALTRLHLPRTAAESWKRFLALEPDGPWATEARRQLARLTDDSRGKRWLRLRPRLLAGAELGGQAARAAVADFPAETRTLCEQELLGAWAAAVVEGDTLAASALLDRAALLADFLAALHGQNLLKDEIGQIRSARPDPVRIERRALAILSFLDAMKRYREQDFARASAALDSARTSLAHQGSPMSLVAELYLAICLHYGDLPGAGALLDEIIERAPERYPTVRGKAWWMLGTVAGGERRFEDAIYCYRVALPLIERSSGRTEAAMLLLLQAEIFDLRGEAARSWRSRIEALEGLSYEGTAQRRFGVAFEAAQALARHRREELALLFLDEALANLDDYGAPAAGAEVHLERARIWQRKGDPERARQELEIARGFIERIEESGLSRRLRAAIDLTEGLALAGSEPAAAVGLLRAAYRLHEDAGYRFDELLYLSGLAEAQRASGDLRGARRSLALAVEVYDQTRRETREVLSRIDAFGHARGAFDQLIDLGLQSSGEGTIEAFDWAERSRARTILDLWSSRRPGGVDDVATAAEVIERLPLDAILLEYAIVGERVICWTVDRGGVRFTELPIRASRLATESITFARALQSRAPPDVLRRQARELYRALVAPLLLELHDGVRLVVVPDGLLRAVPFSALVDPRSDSYLVEQAAVSMTPSATLFLLAEEQSVRRWRGFSPLVVGAPDLRRGPYAILPPLPSARREAKGIASYLPGARLLLAREATRDRVLELLPGFGAFHFSGHALSSTDDWNASALVLSPAGERDDGLLRLGDLLDTPVDDLRLVSLSACGTLAGYDGGREGTMGLAQAFFAAGVPSVVGTLWEVEDSVSSELMRSFYLQMETAGTAAEALRLATLEWLGRDEQSDASPALWAAFAVIGV